MQNKDGKNQHSWVYSGAKKARIASMGDGGGDDDDDRRRHS